MAFTGSDALVLREVRYKESDRILTLFTPERGIVTAKARGALRKSSRIAAATQQLTLSEMTFFENRGKLTVQEALVKEPFEGLRLNFENFALGCYFAECIEAFVQEENPDPDSFQLILNSLYAVSHELCDPLLVKAAFEVRLMCLMGYTPDLSVCCFCGEEQPVSPVLGVQTGKICCRKCRTSELGAGMQLCSASLAAMRYLVSAPARRLFSFTLPEEALRRLNQASETYLATQASRRFATLEYWKKICSHPMGSA
ncbi:MAG: DNA repair protein RecO [Oscillospiraceae bacterium]|nr:DNA repair protein RecO [Oscillospiraceae bacterium]